MTLHLRLLPDAEPQLYQAILDFQDLTQNPMVAKISFLDTDPESAAAAVSRWWHNRRAAFPDHFHQLQAIKVWTLVPQRIGEDGVLPSDRQTVVYEWRVEDDNHA